MYSYVELKEICEKLNAKMQKIESKDINYRENPRWKRLKCRLDRAYKLIAMQRGNEKGICIK